jgi:hypothetical protein
MPDKVASGDIIEPRAGLWNDMVDAASAHKRQRLGLARRPRPPKITPPDRVKVQNNTGGNLAAGSVVELGDFLLSDEVNGYLWLEGDTPSDLDGVHVILRQAVPNDDFGEAQIIGTVVARVNVNHPGHEYAEVVASQTALNSTDDVTPFRILHAPGTGSQDCVVLIDRTKPAEIARYIEGTLNAHMGHTTPGVTEATVARYWGGTAPPGIVTVLDADAKFPRALAGAKFTAIRDELTSPMPPVYRLVACQQQCKKATAFLTEDMCPETASDTFGIEDFAPLDFSPFNQLPSPLPTVARNHHFLAGTAGDGVTIHWDDVLEDWYFVQVDLKEVEVPVAWRYNAAECRTESLRQKIYVPLCGFVSEESEGDWQPEHQLTEITYATGVQAAAGESQNPVGEATACKIQTTRAKLCGFAAPESADAVDSITLHEVEVVVDVEATTSELLQHVQSVFVICSGAVDDVSITAIDDCPEEV